MASTTEFSRTLSLLRQERGVSQRTAAGDLGISQALLSHYENGIREPGLAFVVIPKYGNVNTTKNRVYGERKNPKQHGNGSTEHNRQM